MQKHPYFVLNKTIQNTKNQWQNILPFRLGKTSYVLSGETTTKKTETIVPIFHVHFLLIASLSWNLFTPSHFTLDSLSLSLYMFHAMCDNNHVNLLLIFRQYWIQCAHQWMCVSACVCFLYIQIDERNYYSCVGWELIPFFFWLVRCLLMLFC